MKSIWFVTCIALVGCGGQVVYQPGDSEGGGGSTSSAQPVGGGVSTGPQPMGCTAHIDCPGANQLCIFQTGECADACDVGVCDACGPGNTCNGCATSACPDCLDCRGACVPKSPNQCDDDDKCDPGFVCSYFDGICVPSCENGVCADPNLSCEPCISGSCCGCDDCVSGCVGLL